MPTKQIDRLLSGTPLHIVDVGASGGLQPRWKRLTSELVSVLIEPDPDAAAELRRTSSSRDIVIDKVLSDRRGEVTFNLCRKATVSSLYPPNGQFFRRFPDPERSDVVRTVRMPADTLDNQLADRAVSDVDFVKLDVHGHEIAILQGAQKAIASAVGMEIEVCFAPLYAGGARFSAIHDFVETAGFDLFDLKRYFWTRKEAAHMNVGRKGQLVVGDALYFRSPESILSSDIDGPKIVRAFCVYLAYGYVDLACVLHSLATDEHRISTEIDAQIATILKRFRRANVVPNFRGRGRLAAKVMALGQRVGPDSCFYCDQEVGN